MRHLIVTLCIFVAGCGHTKSPIEKARNAVLQELFSHANSDTGRTPDGLLKEMHVDGLVRHTRFPADVVRLAADNLVARGLVQYQGYSELVKAESYCITDAGIDYQIKASTEQDKKREDVIYGGFVPGGIIATLLGWWLSNRSYRKYLENLQNDVREIRGRLGDLERVSLQELSALKAKRNEKDSTS